MYCTTCGRKFAADDVFCFQCGARRLTDHASIDHSRAEREWETCEIKFLLGGASGCFGRKRAYAFCAEKSSEQGPTYLARSHDFDGRRLPGLNAPERSPGAELACDHVVWRLTKDGWEPTSPSGPLWFSHRFMRPESRGASASEQRELDTPGADPKAIRPRLLEFVVATAVVFVVVVGCVILGSMGESAPKRGSWADVMCDTNDAGPDIISLNGKRYDKECLGVYSWTDMP